MIIAMSAANFSLVGCRVVCAMGRNSDGTVTAGKTKYLKSCIVITSIYLNPFSFGKLLSALCKGRYSKVGR